MKKILLSAALLASLSTTAWSKNDVETVASVTTSRSLVTPIDLTITDINNALTATIDISNEDAAVVFANVNPQTVINQYLKFITINGAAASLNGNCRVSIYGHGAIVMPQGRNYPALTVYTDYDFKGDSRTFVAGGRQVMTGKWDNSIMSFKLKRGYMATLANHADGTGYSHCYIADREDLHINLAVEQAGRTTMLRVFKWNWVTKKGCSDARDGNMMNASKATWFYDWGAGTHSQTNFEYVPQRHHEAGESNGQGYKGAWSGWDAVNASDETVTHVLGQNEPDNTSGAGEVYTYVSTIPANPREKHATSTLVEHAKEFLYSGKRIGTFACTNPRADWVKEYVDYCRKHNIRIDFVATHYYIGGQSPQGCIDRLWSLYNATGLPVWVTEWNNGANWTNESGFQTDSEGWYSWGGGRDNYKNGVWLRDVLKRADLPQNTNWLERLAVYNAVEGKREIFTNGQITEGGKVWGSHESNWAYDSEAGSINYFMPWTNYAPENLSVTYNKSKGTATFTWTNLNSDMTEEATIEKKNGYKWETVAKIEKSDLENLTYTLDVKDYENGLHEFRITNNDYDGKRRSSNETVNFTVATANNVGSVQFGHITVASTDKVQTDLVPVDQRMNSILGMLSFKNSTNGIVNHVFSNGASNFTFRLYPWAYDTPVSLSKAETVDYLSLPNDTLCDLPGGMRLVTGSVSGFLKTDPVHVTFAQPFPDGVVPVVLVQQMCSSATQAPAIVKAYNITSTGFDLRLVRQEKETSSIALQKAYYFACTPGQVGIGGGKLLTVGRNEEAVVGGRTNVNVPLLDANKTPLALTDPYIVAMPQTHNYDVASVFRCYSVNKDEEGNVTALNIRRQTDPTATTSLVSNKTNGDIVGYFIISEDLEGSTNDKPVIATAINDITVDKVQGFWVSTEGGQLRTNAPAAEAYNAAGQRVGFGERIPSGIYVVKSGQRSRKVIVK